MSIAIYSLRKDTEFPWLFAQLPVVEKVALYSLADAGDGEIARLLSGADKCGSSAIKWTVPCSTLASIAQELDFAPRQILFRVW
jgi:hypothetical protein